MLVIYVGLLAVTHIVLFPGSTWQGLAWPIASAVGGAALATLLSLVIGFGKRSLPRELGTSIDRARQLLPTRPGKADLSMQPRGGERLIELTTLDELAHVFAKCASYARTRLTLFRQGIGRSAWDQLQPLQHDFELSVSDFMQGATQQAEKAESPEFGELWRKKFERARELKKFVDDAMNGLAARIGHYQSLTALIVALTSLVVSMLGVVLRLLPAGKTP
jgi:hypothetical protein